jgi:hypothetical protein
MISSGTKAFAALQIVKVASVGWYILIDQGVPNLGVCECYLAAL